jgi:hypothetical protein
MSGLSEFRFTSAPQVLPKSRPRIAPCSLDDLGEPCPKIDGLPIPGLVADRRRSILFDDVFTTRFSLFVDFPKWLNEFDKDGNLSRPFPFMVLRLWRRHQNSIPMPVNIAPSQ